MEITEKLIELGFELKEDYYGNEAYVYRTPRVKGLRFVHDFVYYEDESQFYINCHKMAGITTIVEGELIRDHNGANAPAKDRWLEIRKELQDYKFNVYGGELWKIKKKSN